MAPKIASRKRSPPSTVKREMPSPETLQKTAKEMEFMKTSATILKVEKPSDWPEDCVFNTRAFGPLPAGWYHAKKMTKASGRGSGGKLHGCFVGPGGKVFWHKRDLEKFLGEKIENPQGVRRPRSLAPAAVLEFPPDAKIRRTEKKSARAESAYIQARCDALDGKTVFQALQSFNYECQGTQFEYKLSDLRYDVRNGNLTVEVDSPEQPSKTLKRKASTGSQKAPPMPTQKAPPTPSQKAPPTPTQSAPPTPTSSRSSRSVSKRPAASPVSLAAQEAKKPQSTLQAISQSVLAPLKHRAASGMNDEKDILALVGAGHELGMDGTMLRVLPEVLRKAPAERGDFGNVVLAQFEAALRA